MDRILDVPYFSQYLDVTNRDHIHRSCAVTSAYMGLKYYGVICPRLSELFDQGIKDGGYNKHGWKHDYLVSMFIYYEISCSRKEQMCDEGMNEIWNSLKKKNPVVISMYRLSFERRILHVVILTGYKEDSKGRLKGFFYHDPAGLHPEEVTNLFVSTEVFLRFWRRMAIFPERNGSLSL